MLRPKFKEAFVNWLQKITSNGQIASLAVIVACMLNVQQAIIWANHDGGQLSLSLEYQLLHMTNYMVNTKISWPHHINLSDSVGGTAHILSIIKM
jgi:hypothetical protein